MGLKNNILLLKNIMLQEPDLTKNYCLLFINMFVVFCTYNIVWCVIFFVILWIVSSSSSFFFFVTCWLWWCECFGGLAMWSHIRLPQATHMPWLRLAFLFLSLYIFAVRKVVVVEWRLVLFQAYTHSAHGLFATHDWCKLIKILVEYEESPLWRWLWTNLMRMKNYSGRITSTSTERRN